MPQQILMTSPEHFDVTNVINPHMQGPDGQPKKINRKLAQDQWRNLKLRFQAHGLKVSVVPASPSLPDMVFAANHGISLGEKNILLGSMRFPSRSAEIAAYRHYYLQYAYKVQDLKAGAFEGQGDAIWCRSGKRLFCGYGFRSDWRSVLKLKNLLAPVEVIPLQLINPNFYHLDTCFTPLNKDTATYVRSAFSTQALDQLRLHYPRLLPLDETEACLHFAGNAYCPDGNHVFIEQSCKLSRQMLQQQGFRPVPVDTSEFIKAGGSVFCLKMELFPA